MSLSLCLNEECLRIIEYIAKLLHMRCEIRIFARSIYASVVYLDNVS